MNKETNLARYFRNIGIRPTFTNNKIFGNLYVVDNLYPKAKFPEKFIGVSDKTNKFYLFDCLCCDEHEFVEYRVIELTYKDFYDISNLGISEYQLYERHMNDIYTYLEDWDGIVYENNDFCILYEDDELPSKYEYIHLKHTTFNNIILLGGLLNNNKLIESKNKEED